MEQGKKKKKTKEGGFKQREQKNQDSPAPRPRIRYTGLVEPIMLISMEKGFQIIRWRIVELSRDYKAPWVQTKEDGKERSMQVKDIKCKG
jgi:hypothetical protein